MKKQYLNNRKQILKNNPYLGIDPESIPESIEELKFKDLPPRRRKIIKDDSLTLRRTPHNVAEKAITNLQSLKGSYLALKELEPKRIWVRIPDQYFESVAAEAHKAHRTTFWSDYYAGESFGFKFKKHVVSCVLESRAKSRNVYTNANLIHVFGSNLTGKHSAYLKRKHGIEEGVVSGPTGKAYALPLFNAKGEWIQNWPFIEKQIKKLQRYITINQGRLTFEISASALRCQGKKDKKYRRRLISAFGGFQGSANVTWDYALILF